MSQSPMAFQDPQMQQTMQNMMPQFLQQMRNPAIQDMMTNPQALNAIMQIQQGMAQLRAVAPEAVGSLGIPAPLPGAAPVTPTAPTPAPGSAAANLTPAPQNEALFADFMSRMMNGMSTGANPTLPPEQRFATQLEHLASMGFVNREANIQGTLLIPNKENSLKNSNFRNSSDRHIWRY